MSASSSSAVTIAAVALIAGTLATPVLAKESLSISEANKLLDGASFGVAGSQKLYPDQLRFEHADINHDSGLVVAEGGQGCM